MPSLVKPWVVRYVGPDGRRAKKGAAGAKKVRERSRLWYGQGLPNLPPKKRVPLAANKEAARRMLEEMVRKAEQGAAGLPDPGAAKKSLGDYLEEFRQALEVGLAGRKKRKGRLPAPMQVQKVHQRVRDTLAGCGFKYPADLNDAAPGKVAKYLAGRRALPLNGGGLSAQTAEYFVSAARRFAAWLARRSAVRADLFDELPGYDAKNNQVRARREVQPAELARLFDATRADPGDFRGLTGPDRVHLYLAAFSTGYRAGELAELLPESFHLDRDPPAVSLPGRITKNGKPAMLPIAPAAAEQLRGYVAARPPGKPVWPGTWSERPAKMLKKDLARAAVPYRVDTQDGPRYADFHALRHTYVSALAAAGVEPRVLQELARHSSPQLTMGVYTHTRTEAVAAGAARLPIPGATPSNPLAALTREQLETAVLMLLGILADRSGCGVQPGVQPDGKKRRKRK